MKDKLQHRPEDLPGVVEGEEVNFNRFLSANITCICLIFQNFPFSLFGNRRNSGQLQIYKPWTSNDLRNDG